MPYLILGLVVLVIVTNLIASGDKDREKKQRWNLLQENAQSQPATQADPPTNNAPRVAAHHHHVLRGVKAVFHGTSFAVTFLATHALPRKREPLEVSQWFDEIPASTMKVSTSSEMWKKLTHDLGEFVTMQGWSFFAKPDASGTVYMPDDIFLMAVKDVATERVEMSESCPAEDQILAPWELEELESNNQRDFFPSALR